MPQKRLEVIKSSSENRVIPISRNKQKKAPSKFNKPHCIIPIDDIQWVVNQTKTVQTLWNECWASDQYGSRWMKLTTSLGDKAFRLARQVLYTIGLFEFKRETRTDDTRKTACWLVKNLHGARRIKEFWMKDDFLESVEETAVNFDRISGINEPDNSLENPNNGQKVPDISPETPDKSSIPELLSNALGTSQELLKEVPVEVSSDEITMNELLDRVRSRGTKIADKLATIMERCLKKDAGETSCHYFKNFFKERYNWRIDEPRLLQILELNQHCQSAFLEQFQYTYERNGISPSRVFDSSLNLVINDTQHITEIMIKRDEYSEYIFKRREQILGNST